jgi:hypothetical protein
VRASARAVILDLKVQNGATGRRRPVPDVAETERATLARGLSRLLVALDD